jgi:hypothetical protein
MKSYSPSSSMLFVVNPPVNNLGVVLVFSQPGIAPIGRIPGVSVVVAGHIPPVFPATVYACM